MRKILLLVAIIFIFASCESGLLIYQSNEEDHKLRVSLFPERPLIGSPVTVEYQLKTPRNRTIETAMFPEMPQEVVGVEWTWEGESLLCRFHVEKPGEIILPQIHYALIGDNYRAEYATQRVNILVPSLLDESQNPAPNHGNMIIGFLRLWHWMVIVASFVLVVLAIYLVKKYLENKQRPLSLAEQLTLRLKNSPIELEDQLSDRDYYLELTAILRHSVDRVWGYRTEGQTREQYLPSIMSVPAIRRDQEAELAEILQRADRAKYCDTQVDMDQRFRDWERVKNVLKKIIHYQEDRESHGVG